MAYDFVWEIYWMRRAVMAGAVVRAAMLGLLR